MHVRPFRDSDSEALARIFFSAVHEIAGAYYTPEQIAAWAPTLPDPLQFAHRATDGRIVLVAADADDRPIAYGDVERGGHLDHLYCLPEAAGCGVAKRLYEELELAARSAGVSVIYVEASEPAKRFFAKQRFELVGRNDFQIDGVPIHNFKMRKLLI